MKTFRLSLIFSSALLLAISGCESCTGTGPYQSKPVIVIEYPPVTQLVFSPDNKFFATISDDDNARLWKNEPSANPQPIATLFHRGKIDSIEFSPDSKRVATKSAGVYYTWTVEPGNDPKPLTTGVKPDFASNYQEDLFPIYSPDEKTYLTKKDDEILLWKNEKEQKEPIARLGEFGRVSFSRNSKYIGNGSVLWTNDPIKPKVIEDFQTRDPKERWVIAGFSDDEKYVATYSPDSTDRKNEVIRIWQLEGSERPQLVEIFRCDEPVVADFLVAFSPDGKSLATVSGSKTNIWRRKE